METREERTIEERANEVYWSSDASVNQIADDFDLSKGALYALIRPLPAGVPCPDCASEMVYSNRTARDKGDLSCPGCGDEEDSHAVVTRGSGILASGAEPTKSETDAWTGGVASGQALNRLVAGTALLGVAAGVALTLWARRR